MKSFFLIIYTLLSLSFLKAQVLQDKINIKSPESYSFEKYGNVPVHLYTGTIDLKIPIISTDLVSLNLSYDSSGFLPHKKSDIAGTGWSLLAGGRITRTVNRIPDQYVGDPPSTGLAVNLFGTAVNMHGFLTGVRMNQYANSDVYSVNTPYTSGFINDWAFGPSNNAYETEPDLFQFNIMNLHGKFMIGNNGEVKVESNDPNLKVDVTGMSNLAMATCIPNDDQIILTDGKGNRYFFGGDFSTYEIGYDTSGSISNNINYETYPKIMAYSISKIILANGKTINYSYMQGTFPSAFANFLNDDFCQLQTFNKNFLIQNTKLLSMESFFQNGYSQMDYYNCNPINSNDCFNSGDSSTFNRENHTLIKKSLLESVKYDENEIKLSYKDIGYPIKQSLLSEVAMANKLYLNETVIDNIELFNNGNLIEKIRFTYSNYGEVDKMRPFLKEVFQERSGKKYSFEYYNVNSLPTYYTKGLDHWGYWNGKDNNTGLAPYDTYNVNTGDYTLNNTFRDTNVQKYNIGLLSKIIYPTKGYSVFEYEPNYYSKRLERNSTSAFLPTLTNNTGVVGGARIHRQYDYSENGGIINDKTFQYTTTLNGTSSSGILMNWPRYFYYIEFLTGNGVVNRKVLLTSSNVQQNSLDSYNVGYSKVFEVDNNKGYTEHNFTSYQDYPDLPLDNGNIKKFLSGAAGAGNPNPVPENLYKNINNTYGIDRSTLRGRPKSDLIYSTNSTLLRKIDYEYTDNINFNPNTSKDENNYVSIHHLSGYWVQGYKRYFNSSVIKKKIVTDFLNNNPIISTTEYYYNSSNHLNLTKENNILPDNSQISKNFSYAQDFNSNYNLMISKNIIGIPLITEVKENNKSIAKTETQYPVSVPTTQTGNLVLPTSILSYDLQNPTVSSTEVTYDKYDTKGNLQQYTTKDGVSTTIIWGYNQTQPIAKITGAKLSDIQQSMIDSIVNASNSDASNPANEPALITALDSFRNNSGLAGYQISTYTYDPLIGVTSITPPSGIREVYLYDTANRLKEIREGNQTGKLLKEFKYNYKN